MTPLDMAYRTAMDERISELLRYRRWWRENRWADWPVIRHDLEVELRALVKVARQARKAARPIEDDLDAPALTRAMYARLPYSNWTYDAEGNVARVIAEYRRLTAIQWERSKAEWDRLQAEDLSLGDHFIGVGR